MSAVLGRIVRARCTGSSMFGRTARIPEVARRAMSAASSPSDPQGEQAAKLDLLRWIVAKTVIGWRMQQTRQLLISGSKVRILAHAVIATRRALARQGCLAGRDEV